jgi:tetratricopeptide (TPR) repeat protein
VAKQKDKDTKLRKELEAPDEFQKQASKGLDYLRERRRGITVAIGAVVGLALVGVLVWEFQRRAYAKSGWALSRAVDVTTRPVEKEGTPPIPERPTGLEPLPHFSTKEEKLSKVAETWREIAEDGSGAAATTARLGEASALFEQGKYDEAAAAYRAFLAEGSDVPAAVAVAHEGLGYSLEAKGDIAGAVAAFGELAKPDPKGFYADVGRYHVARLKEAQGQKDQAITEYKAILADFPTGKSLIADSVKQRLRALGVEPPPQAAPPAPEPLE